MNIMLWVWLAAIVVFGIAEAVTAGLVSIWFVGGAVAALVATLLGGGTLIQVILFLVVSAVLLAATRPFARRAMRGGKTATNADRVLGMDAKVTEQINNLTGTGAVYADGKTWTARSDNEENIPVGTVVTVLRMEGVKLFVKKCEKMEGAAAK